MGILWPHSNTVIRTNTDARAAGAKIYFFEAGTTTPRTSYQDADLSSPHTHPVIADAYGRAPAVFLDFGHFRERVRTSGDTTLWDTDDIPNPSPVSDEDDVDPNAIFQTGDSIIAFKNGTRDGFVRCNGRTIGSATSGASERANPDCEDLFLYIWNNFANGQAAVSTGRGVSAAADWVANKTIALPNARGAGLIGFDDMGNSAASLLGSAPVVSGSGILAGSIIGANTHTLSSADVPAHTHSFSATTGAGGSHTHSFSATTSSNGGFTPTGTINDTRTWSWNRNAINDVAGGGANGSTGQSAGAFNVPVTVTAGSISFAGDAVSAHTHTLSGTTGAEASHTHSVSGTSGSYGSGGAHNILSRSIPVTVLIKL